MAGGGGKMKKAVGKAKPPAGASSSGNKRQALGDAQKHASGKKKSRRGPKVDKDAIYEADEEVGDEVKNTYRYDAVESYEYEMPADFEDEEIDEEMAFSKVRNMGPVSPPRYHNCSCPPHEGSWSQGHLIRTIPFLPALPSQEDKIKYAAWFDEEVPEGEDDEGDEDVDGDSDDAGLDLLDSDDDGEAAAHGGRTQQVGAAGVKGIQGVEMMLRPWHAPGAII